MNVYMTQVLFSGRQHLSRSVYAFIDALSKIDQNYYPEILNKMVEYCILILPICSERHYAAHYQLSLGLHNRLESDSSLATRTHQEEGLPVGLQASKSHVSIIDRGRVRRSQAPALRANRRRCVA